MPTSITAAALDLPAPKKPCNTKVHASRQSSHGHCCSHTQYVSIASVDKWVCHICKPFLIFLHRQPAYWDQQPLQRLNNCIDQLKPRKLTSLLYREWHCQDAKATGQALRPTEMADTIS